VVVVVVVCVWGGGEVRGIGGVCHEVGLHSMDCGELCRRQLGRYDHHQGMCLVVVVWVVLVVSIFVKGRGTHGVCLVQWG
jgi:hypothetical protein